MKHKIFGNRTNVSDLDPFKMTCTEAIEIINNKEGHSDAEIVEALFHVLRCGSCTTLLNEKNEKQGLPPLVLDVEQDSQ